MNNNDTLQVGKVEFNPNAGPEKEKHMDNYTEDLQRSGYAAASITLDAERAKMEKEFLQKEKELNKREEELNKKELKLKAMEVMYKRHVSYELLEVLNYEDIESLEKALDMIAKYIKKRVFEDSYK